MVVEFNLEFWYEVFGLIASVLIILDWFENKSQGY